MNGVVTPIGSLSEARIRVHSGRVWVLVCTKEDSGINTETLLGIIPRDSLEIWKHMLQTIKYLIILLIQI